MVKLILTMNNKYSIILASQSPRRQELLSNLGIDYTLRKLNVEETFPETMDVRKIAKFLAEKKAHSLTLNENEIGITADTTVVCEDRVLNKAASYEEAVEMLEFLSGRQHEVYSGVCVKSASRKISFDEMTAVHFNRLNRRLIDHYIETCKPYDKAGAYGIQDWIGLIAVKKIEGSYTNVLGLPTVRLYEILQQWDKIESEEQ